MYKMGRLPHDTTCICDLVRAFYVFRRIPWMLPSTFAIPCLITHSPHMLTFVCILHLPAFDASLSSLGYFSVALGHDGFHQILPHIPWSPQSRKSMQPVQLDARTCPSWCPFRAMHGLYGNLRQLPPAVTVHTRHPSTSHPFIPGREAHTLLQEWYCLIRYDSLLLMVMIRPLPLFYFHHNTSTVLPSQSSGTDSV